MYIFCLHFITYYLDIAVYSSIKKIIYEKEHWMSFFLHIPYEYYKKIFYTYFSISYKIAMDTGMINSDGSNNQYDGTY